MKSIAFDRAADVYDETRGFPPGIADRVADSAASVMSPGAQILDIGVGTGRIARPLAARGMRVFGLDLSRKMMRRLIETLPPGAPAPALVEADAVDLPFAPAEFDAAVSVHVFHLLADWRAALAEARRILKPDGIVLTGYEWRPPDSASERLLTAWKDIVRAKGLDPGHRPGAGDFEEIKSELFAMGAAMDEWSAGEWETRRTIAHHIETIEHRTWSSTWGVPDDFFPQCLAELRAWAVSQFGALDREFVAPRRFVWQRFRWG